MRQIVSTNAIEAVARQIVQGIYHRNSQVIFNENGSRYFRNDQLGETEFIDNLDELGRVLINRDNSIEFHNLDVQGDSLNLSELLHIHRSGAGVDIFKIENCRFPKIIVDSSNIFIHIYSNSYIEKLSMGSKTLLLVEDSTLNKLENIEPFIDQFNNKYQCKVMIRNARLGNLKLKSISLHFDSVFENIFLEGELSFDNVLVSHGGNGFAFSNIRGVNSADRTCQVQLNPNIVINGLLVSNPPLAYQFIDISNMNSVILKGKWNVDETNVLLKRCDLSAFDIHFEQAHYLELEDCSWGKSWLWSEPFFGFRTFRRNGFGYPGKIDKKKFALGQVNQYLKLMKEAKNSGDKLAEQDFYYAKMWWELNRSISLNKTLPHITIDLVNYLYFLTCGYGMSFVKPLFWMFLVWLGFSLYYSYEIFNIDPGFKSSIDYGSLISFAAIVPTFDLEGIYPEVMELIHQKSKWFYPIFYLERGIQLFLLFEFASAVRNRVKK